jgi:hypothetical protein
MLALAWRGFAGTIVTASTFAILKLLTKLRSRWQSTLGMLLLLLMMVKKRPLPFELLKI